MDFLAAFKHVVGTEGGFNAAHDDAGNWTGGRVGVGELKGTKFGISAASYPHLDIKNLTLAQAQAIYRSDYWGKLGCDMMPDRLRLAAFDYAVNSGVWQAATDLQECVGATPDGLVGPLTLAALARSNPTEVLIDFTAKRLELMVGAKLWETRSRGWTNRVIRVLRSR